VRRKRYWAGHALEHHRRRLSVVDAVRDGDQAIGRHQPFLGIGADRRVGVGDPVAGLELGDAGAHRLDHAGRFEADDSRQGTRRIEAGPMIDVDVIEPDRRLPNARLTRPWCADVDVLVFQHFGSAVLVDANGLGHDGPHRFRLSSSARPAAADAILVDPLSGGKNPLRISRKRPVGSNDRAPGNRAPE